MELHDACALSQGESIILEDGNIGRNKKVVLTNKRLIFLESKGEFDKTYHKEDEIPIDDIEFAHYDAEFGAIVLQLKNGEKDLIPIVGFDSLDVLLSSAVTEVKMQATIDRWVNAINTSAKRGSPAAKRIRCSCCNQIYDEALSNCPTCGASR